MIPVKTLRRVMSTGIAALVMLQFLTGCMSGQEVAGDTGSGTNTGNSLTGTYYFPGDEPAAFAQVSIRPVDFIKNTDDTVNAVIYDLTTDASGRLNLDSIVPGTYNVEVYDNNQNANLQTITISSDTGSYVLDDAVLMPVATVGGWVSLPQSQNTATAQVIGTIHSAGVNPESGRFLIQNVPAGAFEFKTWITWNDSIISHQVPVTLVSSETLEIPALNLEEFRDWSYSKSWNVSTEFSTGPLSAALSNFPFYLELNANNFAFADAGDNGEDFRITDEEGELVWFEIDHWDKASEKAGLWVLLETLSPDPGSNSFITFWGHPNTDIKSGGDRVFPWDQGYMGAWHMSSLTSENTPDASGGDNFGIPVELSTDTSITPGIMGSGIQLDGNNQYLTSETMFSDPNEFTLSIWIKTSSATGGRILGFSSPQLVHTGHNNSERMLWMDDTGYIHFGVFNDSLSREEWFILERDSIMFKDSEFDNTHRQIISTTTAVNDGSWHFIAATLSGAGMKLYLDGSLIATKPEITFGANRNGWWVMGAGELGGWHPKPDTYYFTGVLDEVRVESSVRNDDWISAYYQLIVNQSDLVN